MEIIVECQGQWGMGKALHEHEQRQSTVCFVCEMTNEKWRMKIKGETKPKTKPKTKTYFYFLVQLVQQLATNVHPN